MHINQYNEGQVRTRNYAQVSTGVQTTADDHGGTLARGMKDLAHGVGQIGTMAFNASEIKQERIDNARVMDTQTQIEGEYREWEKGVLDQYKGIDAVNLDKMAEKWWTDRRDQALKGFDNRRQRDNFLPGFQRAANRSVAALFNHSTKEAFRAESNARTTRNQAALIAAQTDGLLDSGKQAEGRAIRHNNIRIQYQGEKPETVAMLLRESDREYFGGIADAHAARSPENALEYLDRDEVKAVFTPTELLDKREKYQEIGVNKRGRERGIEIGETAGDEHEMMKLLNQIKDPKEADIAHKHAKMTLDARLGSESTERKAVTEKWRNQLLDSKDPNCIPDNAPSADREWGFKLLEAEEKRKRDGAVNVLDPEGRVYYESVMKMDVGQLRDLNWVEAATRLGHKSVFYTDIENWYRELVQKQAVDPGETSTIKELISDEKRAHGAFSNAYRRMNDAFTGTARERLAMESEEYLFSIAYEGKLNTARMFAKEKNPQTKDIAPDEKNIILSKMLIEYETETGWWSKERQLAYQAERDGTDVVGKPVNPESLSGVPFKNYVGGRVTEDAAAGVIATSPPVDKLPEAMREPVQKYVSLSRGTVRQNLSNNAVEIVPASRNAPRIYIAPDGRVDIEKSKGNALSSPPISYQGNNWASSFPGGRTPVGKAVGDIYADVEKDSE